MIPLNLPDRLKRIDTEERLHTEQHLILPPKVEPTVSALSEEAVAATLCSALQLYGNEISIVGQQSTRKQIDSNPLVAINFSQPLVQVNIYICIYINLFSLLNAFAKYLCRI